MLGHDPAHKLAAVYAGQFFLRDKLQLDGRGIEQVTRTVSRGLRPA